MQLLKNWRIVHPDTDGFMAPEQLIPQLKGQVYNSKKYGPGEMIRTSPIASVDGKVVTTESGTEYTLSEPNEAYVEHCKAQGWHVPTADEPIRVTNNEV